MEIEASLIHCVQDQLNPDEEVARFLSTPNRPTAVFCVNDHNALVMMRVCKELGLKVPDDISLIGFDDTEEASHADPPLTTLSVPKEYLGRLAVRRLLLQIQSVGTKMENDPPIVTQVPVTLVKRQSCRAINVG